MNETDPMHTCVREPLLTKFHFEGSVEVDGQQITCIHPIEWYGKDNAFEIDVHRRRLGKISAFKELHQYLIELTQNGTIERQEAVSMLPPLLLDVQPTDIVLDMCAAPGSKTFQLLERVHGHSGFVIANEADSRRAYMLVNQTGHLRSNNIVITNHLGQQFPFITVDRVLCDVPCSGDGTLVTMHVATDSLAQITRIMVQMECELCSDVASSSDKHRNACIASSEDWRSNDL